MSAKKYQKIHQVIGRMHSTITLFKAKPEYNHLIPFLHTYKLVTEHVLLQEKMIPGFYRDFKAMSRLDEQFAELYFQPLDRFLSAGQANLPWSTYFDYCMHGADSPFLQLLMGINVHINADLPHALVEANYTSQEDFEVINTILLKTIPDMMHYLFYTEHDPVGLAGMLMRRFFVYEFKHIIVKWRSQAWRHSQQLRAGKVTQLQLDESTDRLSAKLWEIWERNYNLVKLPILIYKLNRLEVNID